MKTKQLFRTLQKLALNRQMKAVAFEITKNCNLKCKHCYRRDFKGQDLTDKQWINIFKKLEKQGFIQAGWCGGEPLLRKELIEKGKKYFPINALITNGTISIPKWNDMLFGVSVDGTPDIYEKIRGNTIKNQYNVVKNNILEAIKNGNTVFALMTIHKINQGVLEEFAESWFKRSVSGVIFDFYTPQIDEPKDTIWLSFKERDKVIERIMKLRKKYGEFLPWNTPEMLNKMKSENCKIHTDNCRKQAFEKEPTSLKLNFKGKRMYPCIMGAGSLKEAKIDCDRCGCIFAFPADKQALWTSFKTIFL